MTDQEDKPGAEYRRGFVAGYQHAKAEELAHYRAMIESGRQIYDRVIGSLINVPSFLERDADRLDTMRTAHAAELHVGRPVLDVPGRKGCPVCMEARAAVYLSTTDETAVHVPHLHDADGPVCSRILCHTTDSRPCWACGGAAPCRVVTEVRERETVTEPWPAGGPDWCGVEIRHLPHPWSLSGDVLGSAPDRRCPGTDAPLKRGPVPAHNGDYVAPQTVTFRRDPATGEPYLVDDVPVPWATGTKCQGDADHPPHPAGSVRGCEACTVNPPVEGSELAPSDRKISGPVACSFHRDGADGYRADCGACVLTTQRAARR